EKEGYCGSVDFLHDTNTPLADLCITHSRSYVTSVKDVGIHSGPLHELSVQHGMAYWHPLMPDTSLQVPVVRTFIDIRRETAQTIQIFLTVGGQHEQSGRIVLNVATQLQITDRPTSIEVEKAVSLSVRRYG